MASEDRVDISRKEAVGLEEFSRRGVFVGRLVLRQYFARASEGKGAWSQGFGKEIHNPTSFKVEYRSVNLEGLGGRSWWAVQGRRVGRPVGGRCRVDGFWWAA